MKYLYSILIVAGAVAVSTYFEPTIGDISNAKCEAFMAMASEASGLPPLDTCPEVRIEPVEWFEALVPPGHSHPVGVVRTADDRVIHILDPALMNPRYSDPMRRDLWDSVLLHEMIHVLQYESGLAPRDFLHCRFMENQAYHLQANYLMRKGIRMAIPGNMGCRS